VDGRHKRSEVRGLRSVQFAWGQDGEGRLGGLPQDTRPIGGKDVIAGDERELVDLGLSGEKSVEGIAMSSGLPITGSGFSFCGRKVAVLGPEKGTRCSYLLHFYYSKIWSRCGEKTEDRSSRGPVSRFESWQLPYGRVSE